MRHRAFVAVGLGLAAGAFALGSAAVPPASPLVQPAQAKTKVTKVKLTDVRIKVSSLKAHYRSGGAIKPKPTVKFEKTKLKAGKQYKLSYSGNIEAGTAKIKLKAAKKTFVYRGKTYRLTGSRTVRFKIVDPVAARLSKKTWYFTGGAVKPKVSVTYKGKTLSESAYKISYSNNVKVGAAKAKISGKGKYARLVRKTLTFKIRQADTSYSLNKFSGTKQSDVAKANSLYRATSKANVKKKFDTINMVADVSFWKDDINWAKAAKEIDVAILRSYATPSSHKRYGDKAKMISDTRYQEYATGCEAQKLPYAAYGYLIFTNLNDSLSKAKKDAKWQAKKFWKASFAKGHKPLYIVLDVEDSNMEKKHAGDKEADPKAKRVAQCTKATIDQLQKCALAAGYGNGVKIGLYVGNHTYETFGFAAKTGRKLLDEQVDFVWIPAYRSKYAKVPSGKYYPDYAFDLWQYTDYKKISGVSSRVDVSLVNTAGPNAHDITWYKER